MQKIFPHCEHRFCVRHHHANFRKKHGSKKCKDLLWNCARASTEARFERCMEVLRIHKARAYDWLQRKVQPRHWCRAFFSCDVKSDLLINNHCEIFNNFILSARDKPIITMMQRIRLLMMSRIRRCRDRMLKNEGKICPRIMEKLAKNEEESYSWSAAWNGGDEYEVSSPYNTFIVNLKERTCSCRRYQLSGIPCYHACAAILDIKDKLEDYVHESYHVETYLKTYSNLLTPLNGRELWEKSSKTPLEAPVVKVQPGRKKKSRNKKNDEPKNKNKLGKFKTVVHCTKCGKAGHNIRGCNGLGEGIQSSAQASTRKRQASTSEVNVCYYLIHYVQPIYENYSYVIF